MSKGSLARVAKRSARGAARSRLGRALSVCLAQARLALVLAQARARRMGGHMSCSRVHASAGADQEPQAAGAGPTEGGGAPSSGSATGPVPSQQPPALPHPARRVALRRLVPAADVDGDGDAGAAARARAPAPPPAERAGAIATAARDGATVDAEEEEENLDDDEPVCYICLGGATADEPLVSPCGCPRRTHSRCYKRWQMYSSGRREETHCRFCDQQLPDWRAFDHNDAPQPRQGASSPAGTGADDGEALGAPAAAAPPAAPKTVSLDITYEGRCYCVTAREGDQEGFVRTVRETFGIPLHTAVDLRFDRIPDPFEDNSTLQFAGTEHFATAMACITNAQHRGQRDA